MSAVSSASGATAGGTAAPPASQWKRILDWTARHPYTTLTLAVLALLGPYLAKPFNMDDPLFIWSARQIHLQPWNPFGFDVNWYGTAQPMWSVTENPPGACYFLAVAAGILGWSEIALHSAFLLPALAVILGTYRLATRFCRQPMLAALATLFTPVFLVSSSTVMCDVLMLAFWVWAAVFWIEGMERDSLARLLIAGALVALAALTKYYAACLIPLFAVHGCILKRKPRWWAVALVIPVAALAAYQWASYSMYHHALLSQAAGYAVKEKKAFDAALVGAGFISLTFTGGCLSVALFLAPWLWGRKALFLITSTAVALTLIVIVGRVVFPKYPWLQDASLRSVEAQVMVWTIAGAFVLAMAVSDVARNRDADAWLLGLWVVGTFVFTAFVNWTINGRSILPMAPAVGILAARRWQSGGIWRALRPLRLLPWAASALFAFLVARSDFLLASAVRQSAEQSWRLAGGQGAKVWFQGHWGFQYYMTALGGFPVDTKEQTLPPGDLLIVPLDNTNLHPPGGPRTELDIPGPRGLTTMHVNIGAGFYASGAGPLPFAFGQVPDEVVQIYGMKPAPAK